MADGRAPSLNAVRAFVHAGRRLSISAAARELNVTQGAVSRLVQALEADLGVPLIIRAGRGIAFTPEGEAYHRQVSPALEQIEAASRFVRQAGRSGLLSISVMPTFAMRWLVPRLAAFRDAHPEILVAVTSGDGPVDFAAERADLAIRYGTPPFGGAAFEKLMDEEVGVVSAPALAGATIRGPADLPPDRLLRHATRPGAWADFLAAHDVAAPEPAQTASFEHFFMLAEAAAAGMGYALVPLFLVGDELARGRLVQPIPQTHRPAGGYYLIVRPGSERLARIGVFTAWLRGEAAAGR